MKKFIGLFCAFPLLLTFCTPRAENKTETTEKVGNGCFLQMLGTLQDGGSPHAGCIKSCCRDLYLNPDAERKIISLGLIDPVTKKTWLFEASPDLPVQLFDLNRAAGFDTIQPPTGIFVTHAHIGHYAGLMYLGREAMSTKQTVVYVMPRFKSFLENNGPWSQLVTLKNIVLYSLENEREVELSPTLRVKPILVPHRDEFSETVGFIIQGPAKKILFIPDIDKWNKWYKNIQEEIKEVDLAFIDGTFYDGREINNRDISEIPHPFISESLELFKNSIHRKKRRSILFILTTPILFLKKKVRKERLWKKLDLMLLSKDRKFISSFSSVCPSYKS